MNTLYPPLVIGGAERSVSLLAEALVRSGDEVAAITLHPSAKLEIEERNGVRVYRLPLRNIYWPFGEGGQRGRASRILWHLLDMWNWRMAREVGRILDIERPDVVHTNNISGFSVAIFREAKRRNIRLVHTLRDYYMLCARYALFRDGAGCERRCAECKVLGANRRPASLRVDAVVGNSRYVLDAHQRFGWFRGVPASVIYSVADVAATADDGLGRVPIHTGDGVVADDLAAGVVSRPVVFGFIGKLEPEKGIEVLLIATGLLRGQDGRQGWSLRIAGRGAAGYVASLKELFPDPRVEWLGFAAPAEFYSSIDVCVVPSIWAEPLPRTLIEAFSAGRSAICAQSGGIPEVARLGKIVETYPARDAAALAARMEAATADPGRWRDGGWLDQTAAARFSDAAITSRYHEVYGGASESAEEQRHGDRPASTGQLLQGQSAGSRLSQRY